MKHFIDNILCKKFIKSERSTCDLPYLEATLECFVLDLGTSARQIQAQHSEFANISVRIRTLSQF